MSPQELAARLGVSVKTVRRLVAAGELPTLRVGGQLRFDEADLEAWLESSRVNPAERGGPEVAPAVEPPQHGGKGEA
jgi:excisionase family DNA binding protein